MLKSCLFIVILFVSCFSYSTNNPATLSANTATLSTQIPPPQYQQDLYFNNVTMADGLNQSSIYAIEKDQYGFTWLGTQDGLHRFDGKKAELVELSVDNIPHFRFIKTLKIINNTLFIGSTEGLITLNLATGEKHYFSTITFKVNTLAIVKNNIWVGSENGIFIVDAKTLKVKKQLNVINDICNNTTRLNKSLCTNDTRAILYQPFVVDNNVNSSKANHINLPNNNDVIWVGTVNGLFTLHLNSNLILKKVEYINANFDQVGSLSSNDIRTLFLDNVNQVWVGTFDGLNVYSRINNRFYRYIIDKDTAPYKTPFATRISSNKVKAISQDKNGYLWVATTQGVNRSDKPINSVLNQANKNTLQWLHFERHNQKPNALLSNLIRSIYTDNEGRVWVGTNKGLSVTNIYRAQKKVLRSFSNNAQLSYILSYRQDKQKNHWLGSRDGLTIISQNGQQNSVKGLEKQPVYSLIFSGDYAWVGTKRGLYQIGINTHTIIKHYNASNSPLEGQYIYSLLPDTRSEENQALWLGTSYGLFKFNYITNNWQYWNKEHGLVHHEIYTLKKINKNLWVGTSGGLSILKEDDHFENIHRDNSTLAANWIFDISQDLMNNIWLATSAGIYRYQSKEVQTNKTINNTNFEYLNILKGNAYAILFDNNNSGWISSNKGIYQYNLTTKKTSQHFEADGYSDIEYIANSVYKSNTGELNFGGISGLTIFAPEQLNDFKIKLPLRISSIEFENSDNKDFISLWQKVDKNQSTPVFMLVKLDIKWHTKKYQVNFTNPYFALPQKNDIKTINNAALVNHQLDLSYISTGQNKIALPKFFKSNVLSVYKHSHPLLSIVALIIYALLILLFAYFVYRHHFLKKHAFSLDSKNKLIEQQQVELKAHLIYKQQLYYQIQHSLKSPISAQKGFMYQINKLLSLSSHDDVPLDKTLLTRKLNKLSQVQEHLAKMVEEILILSKNDSTETLTSINVLLTIGKIKKVFEILIVDKNLAINYAVDSAISKSIFIQGPKDGLFTILENLLSNAVKFSFTNSQINCNFKINNNKIKITIEDFGIGIPENELNNVQQAFYRASNSTTSIGTGIGLNIVTNTLNSMQGKLLINSCINTGTEVRVTIPLLNKANS